MFCTDQGIQTNFVVWILILGGLDLKICLVYSGGGIQTNFVVWILILGGPDLKICLVYSGGGIGRHAGLKILLPETAVTVRPRSRVQKVRVRMKARAIMKL